MVSDSPSPIRTGSPKFFRFHFVRVLISLGKVSVPSHTQMQRRAQVHVSCSIGCVVRLNGRRASTCYVECSLSWKGVKFHRSGAGINCSTEEMPIAVGSKTTVKAARGVQLWPRILAQCTPLHVVSICGVFHHPLFVTFRAKWIKVAFGVVIHQSGMNIFVSVKCTSITLHPWNVYVCVRCSQRMLFCHNE